MDEEDCEDTPIGDFSASNTLKLTSVAGLDTASHSGFDLTGSWTTTEQQGVDDPKKRTVPARDPQTRLETKMALLRREMVSMKGPLLWRKE